MNNRRRDPGDVQDATSGDVEFYRDEQGNPVAVPKPDAQTESEVLKQSVGEALEQQEQHRQHAVERARGGDEASGEEPTEESGGSTLNW